MIPGSSVGRASGCARSAKKGRDLAKKDTRKYSDRKQYLIKAVQKRRKKIRSMAVDYTGGQCENCGYGRCIDALEFHHTDPTKKDFSISEKGYTRSWAVVTKGLDKCIMLCANCHREVHAKVSSPQRKR